MRVVTLRERVSFWDHYVRGSVECCYYFFEGCSEDIMYPFLFLLLDALFLYMRSCDHLQTYIVLIFSYILLMYVFLSPTLSRVVYFLSLYTCFLLFVCNLLFCFTQRCLDEFCLKCFRNTGCQSLLAINSLFATFFKSLCQDRFYCIQQVNMS